MDAFEPYSSPEAYAPRATNPKSSNSYMDKKVVLSILELFKAVVEERGAGTMNYIEEG